MNKSGPEIVSATLAGTSFVAVSQIATRSNLTASLYIALICYAIAIPGLIATYSWPPYASSHTTWRMKFYYLAFVVLSLIAIIGHTSLFFHFGVVPGCCFIGGSIIYFILMPSARAIYEKENAILRERSKRT